MGISIGAMTSLHSTLTKKNELYEIDKKIMIKEKRKVIIYLTGMHRISPCTQKLPQ
jgi:hypothetical protein